MSRRDHFKQLQQQRYAKRKYRNPYVEAKKKNRRSFKMVAVILILGAAIFFLLNFLLRSPIYEIKQVMVQGTETIDPAEISALAEAYLNQPRLIFSNQRNRFLFDEAGLRKTLTDNYSFETLDFTIKQNSLQISLQEKASELLWISQEIIYLVDLSGAVIRELSAEELAILNQPMESPASETATEDIQPVFIHPLKTLPKFRDLNDLDTQAGQQVLTTEEIENIFAFHEKLNNLQISFFETRIDRLAGKWMSVLAEAGYDILFDATGNIDQQAKNLEVIIRESIGEADEVEYIDLRFGDHVYYK